MLKNCFFLDFLHCNEGKIFHAYMLYLKKLNFNQGINRIELNIHEINVFGKELWLLLQDEEIISDLQFLSK